MRRLSLMSGMVLAAAVGWQVAPVFAQTPPPAMPAATSPPEATPTVLLPNGLTATSTVTRLDDGLSGTLITTTIANPPIPDSPAARRAYGGPESATGRATVPQPGMATTVRPAAKPYGPQLPVPSTKPSPPLQPMTLTPPTTPTGDPPR